MILPAATGGTARHSLTLETSLRPLLAYMKGIVIPSGLFAATDDFGTDNTLPKRIQASVQEFAGLLVKLHGVQVSATSESSAGYPTAVAVTSAQTDGALVRTDDYDEASGANSGSFFGVAKGTVIVDAGPSDDPHRLTVTPFEQLLQDAHDG